MLVRFESLILSNLFSWLATKEELQIDNESLDRIRTVVAAKHLSRGRQNIPHDLIHDEYEVTLEAVRQLRLANLKGNINSVGEISSLNVSYALGK